MNKRTGLIILFSMGLAFVEAVVVVYLRAIFYPQGFVFPLQGFLSDDNWLRFLRIETCREAATLVILFSSSYLFGKNFRTRSAYFLIIFAIWDIFYYVWLKLLLGWPGSLLDWDILFLIPLVWAAPVLAPLILSLTMFSAAMLILAGESEGKAFQIPRCGVNWFMLIGLILISHFCYAGLYICQADYTAYFSWPLFIACELALLILIVKYYLKSRADASP